MQIMLVSLSTPRERWRVYTLTSLLFRIFFRIQPCFHVQSFFYSYQNLAFLLQFLCYTGIVSADCSHTISGLSNGFFLWPNVQVLQSRVPLERSVPTCGLELLVLPMLLCDAVCLRPFLSKDDEFCLSLTTPCPHSRFAFNIPMLLPCCWISVIHVLSWGFFASYELWLFSLLRDDTLETRLADEFHGISPLARTPRRDPWPS